MIILHTHYSYLIINLQFFHSVNSIEKHLLFTVENQFLIADFKKIYNFIRLALKFIKASKPGIAKTISNQSVLLWEKRN